jgi:hypothetical protein
MKEKSYAFDMYLRILLPCPRVDRILFLELSMATGNLSVWMHRRTEEWAFPTWSRRDVGASRLQAQEQSGTSLL